MFPFGIGSSVNRHLIEGMAHVGMGEPFVITKPDEAPSQAERFRKMIQSPVLTDVKATFNGFAAYGVEPVSIPDVLAERPVIVFGKWHGKPQGKITVSGISGQGQYADSIDVSTVHPQKTNAALRYLWARHRITLLSDYNKLRSDDKRIKEVTELGLTYNLLTAYTSFVAIDSRIRNKDGKPETVNQPLPLPRGVSDYAVGENATAKMPPVATLSSSMNIQRKSAQYDTVTKTDKGLHGTGNSKVKEENKTTAVTIVEIIGANGGLPKKIIQNTIEKNMKRFETCPHNNTSRGTFTIILTINSDGSVKNIRTISETSQASASVMCFIDVLKKLLFPAAANGSATTVTITFAMT